ncbi:MAG TPA: sugar phosphate isomerase/epimerase family protein [Candidatus Sulfotelmatobacter sp.]|nr:sugar phosphate isomerase/epimerase family protein [Candidatus Sulfotelmatobacter sp.]
MKPTRREFLLQSCAATAGLCLADTSALAAPAQPSVQFPKAPRERVAVASYPFREFIAGHEHKSGNPVIELKDFAAHVVQKFNVRHIEPWSGHFASTEPAYLDAFRVAAAKADCGIANIAVDDEGSPYAADREEREKAVAFRTHWIDVAAAIGSPSVRTNIAPAKDSKPDAARLAESLKVIAAHGEKKNVVVHLENDNAVSEDPFFLVELIEKVNSPWLHALPDFGNTLNTHDNDYNFRALDAMFAHAYGICHVKSGEVTEQGKATHVVLARTFAILKKHGYKGYCSIEYDAPGDPYAPTAELIEKTIQFLS